MEQKNRGIFDGHRSHFFGMSDVERLPLDLRGDAIFLLEERELNWQDCGGDRTSFKPIGNLLKWVNAKNHADRFSGGLTHGDFKMKCASSEEEQESLLEGIDGLMDEVEEISSLMRNAEVSAYFEGICDSLRKNYGEKGVEECQFLDEAIPALKGKSTRRKQQAFKQILKEIEELREEVGQGAHNMLKFVSKKCKKHSKVVGVAAAQIEMF